MKVVTFNKSPRLFDNLFNYFNGSTLNENSSYDLFMNEAIKFIHSNEGLEEKMQELASLSAYDLSQYKFPEQISEIEIINKIVSFDNFLNAVKNELRNYKPEAYTFTGRFKQVSPPYEDYHYVGHNELDIIPSNISHGLLYEND